MCADKRPNSYICKYVVLSLFPPKYSPPQKSFTTDFSVQTKMQQ